jgi:transcriptional regulator with XRE-family HTH domain
MADDTPGKVTLAQKIDALFRAPGREYTYAEVAEGIRKQGGPTIATTQLWELRHGVKANPRIEHVAALARFFGVPVRTFFPDDELGADLVARPALRHALRDPQVERLALRASGLSPRTLRAIAAIIERAREIEGLEDGDAAPEDRVAGGAAPGRADPAEPNV